MSDQLRWFNFLSQSAETSNFIAMSARVSPLWTTYSRGASPDMEVKLTGVYNHFCEVQSSVSTQSLRSIGREYTKSKVYRA